MEAVFFEYLSQTANDSVPPRFAEATAGQFIPFRVGRPLRRVGVNLEESWTRAVATAGSATAASRSRLIMGRLRSEPLARVSPDGKSLAYVYNDGRGAQRLRVVDTQTFAEQRSHRTTGQVSFDWLGDTLLIAQLDFTNRWTLRSDLWKWMPDGAWKRETTGQRLIERGWVAVSYRPWRSVTGRASRHCGRTRRRRGDQRSRLRMDGGW